ncbi:MAG: hypothetical protein PF447_12860 [Spirochaetaceae bacterium]|jgi:hypothetical protein|nr:hypothetical protein [Spirochaetaceae bacterium]
MTEYAFEDRGYSLSSDENDLFDENLDLFDYLQYGAFEDGIAYSKNHDEEELRDEENDTEYDLEDQPELDFAKRDPGEMEDYDNLDD